MKVLLTLATAYLTTMALCQGACAEEESKPQPTLLIGDSSSSMSKSWGAIAIARKGMSISFEVVLNERAILPAQRKVSQACAARNTIECKVVATFTGCVFIVSGIQRAADGKMRPKYLFDIDTAAVVDQCHAVGYEQCGTPVGGCTQGVAPEKTFIVGTKDAP